MNLVPAVKHIFTGSTHVASCRSSGVVEPLLLTTAHVSTFAGQCLLSNASGFYFERDQRLYLVTSRHVVFDALHGHFPDRIELELHVDADNLAESVGFSIPLYVHGRGVWRQGVDGAGDIDVAVIELDRRALPAHMAYRAFMPAHIPHAEDVEIGASLLVAGFPLGFHDKLHHLPVVRQAVVASSYGLRFQGEGYFLTDARTHRGTSGAPVVMRAPDAPDGRLSWLLLGIHSSRLDVGSRDFMADEALGLNSAWYSDILLTLTEPASPRAMH